MNRRNIFLVVVFTLFIIDIGNSVVVQKIDNFNPPVPGIQVFPANASGQPVSAFTSNNGDITVGIERDSLIYLDSKSQQFKIATTSIVDDSWVIGLSQGASGYAQLQYDGADNSPTLTLFPGLQGLDLTSTLSASAFEVSISSDHNSVYVIRVYGSQTTTVSSYTINVPPTPNNGNDAITYIVPFSAFTGNANFRSVFAITITMDTNLVAQSTAIDTSVVTFNTIGTVISGSAFYDCDSDGSIDDGELPFAGANVSLQTTTGTVLQTTTTNSNGTFSFLGLTNLTYNVCVTAAGATNTGPSCKPAVLTNYADVTGLTYGLLTPATVVAPPNVNIPACSCTTPECTGNATGNSCGGAVISYNDVVSTSVCPQTITRTWSITGGASTSVQIITLTDSTSPQITTPASSVTVPCSSQVPTLSTWLATNGGAAATDCNTFTWSNNWDTFTPATCGNKTVTFTVTDACGNSNTTTATWAVEDIAAPTFSKQSTNQDTECDRIGGNDQIALTTWLNSAGGAIYSDNCASVPSITLQNNYVGSVNRGCYTNSTVTFTISDSCGNSAQSIAIFSVIDTAAPQITTSASNSQAECSSDGSAETAFSIWVTSNGGAAAVDACSTEVTWTNDASDVVLNESCNGQTTVIFTAHDSCGHSSTTSAFFVIKDDTPPRITNQAAAASAPCDSDYVTAFDEWVASQGGAEAVDDCTSVNWSDNSATVTLNDCGVVFVTFTATDTCNSLSASTIGNFTVTDSTPPTFTTDPQDLSVECNSNVAAQFNTWLTNIGGGEAEDSCSSNVRYLNNFGTATPPSTCGQSVRVTFTAVDGCENPTQKAATFSVVDTTPPVINPLPQSTTVECNTATNQDDYNLWLSTNAGAEAQDPCGAVTFTRSGPTNVGFPANGGCSATQTVIFNATDICGQTSSASASFTVTDSFNPTMNKTASSVSIECDSASNQFTFNAWLASHGGAVATDTCSAVTWANDFDTFTQTSLCIRTATVIFTASDACGHETETSASFTITDSKAPFIPLPGAQDAFAECDGYGNAAVIDAWIDSNGGATATDACDSSDNLIWTNDFGDGAITTCTSAQVTFTVTDSCGLSSNTTATFHVQDTTKPVFNPAASDVTVECDGAGNFADYSNFVASHGGAVAFDVCSTSPIGWSSNAPGVGPNGCGSVRVAFLATDNCGNFAFTNATYRVIDSFAPEITNDASNATYECDGTSNIVQLDAWLFNRAGAEASDSCSVVSWSNNFRKLNRTSNCEETATVTFTASDTCGNTASTTATFVSEDTTPPFINPGASPLVIACDAAVNPAQIQAYLRNRGGASAEDLCASTTWSNNYVPVSNSCSAGVSVTFTASDVCGNKATTIGEISVDDEVAPDFVSFPTDKSLECDECYDVECTGTPVITDDCAPASSLELTHEDFFTERVTIGYCPGDQILTRVWTASDGCGNSVSRNQTIVIQIAPLNGPCTPAVCPPCEDQGPTCCEENSAPLGCLPVICKAVACLQVPCTPVECIPQVCGSIPANSPTPIPAPPPTDDYYYFCEPFYVYVYNDDGADADDDADPVPIIKYIYEYVSYGDASAQSAFSLITLVIVVLSLIL